MRLDRPVAALRRWVGPLTVRRNLLAAFLSLAFMAGLCGLAGWVFFGRIAGSVSVLSEVTSPLLIESMALTGNLDRLRSTFIEDAPQGDEQLSALSRLDTEGRDHIHKLNALAKGAGLAQQFGPVEQLQRDLVAGLRALAYVRARRNEADAAVRAQYAQIVTQAALADRIILTIARKFESNITEAEEAAKTQIQAGAATLDELGAILQQTMVVSFPGLQYAHRMMRATARVRERAEAARSVAGELDLQNLEVSAGRLFKTMSSIRQKLGTRMRSPEDAGALAELDARLAELQLALLGPNGTAAKKRRFLSATSQLTANLKQVSEIEALYSEILLGVAAAVRDRNDASKRLTATTIVQGRTAIATVVALTALMALVAAGFLTRRITTPLDRLIGHVRAIRERGRLIEISRSHSGASVRRARRLSRSFNAMIAELSEARRQLIASRRRRSASRSSGCRRRSPTCRRGCACSIANSG